MKQRHYKTVVVGGGVIGCSIATHLAGKLPKARGIASTLLMESETLTSGTTWHAAGMVTQIKGAPIMSELSLYSKERYKEWKDIGWHSTGSLAMARSEERWQQLLLNSAHLKHLDIPFEVFTKQNIDAVKALHPLIDTQHYHGAIYLPTDGIVNPADVTMRIAQEARERGAEIVQNCPLLDVTVEKTHSNQRVTVLHTAKADITCDNVVIAGGQWTRQLCKLIPGAMGIPVAPASHQYVMFDKVEGVTNSVPVVRDYDSRIYIKPEVGGLAVGVFEQAPPQRPISRELYEEDMDKSEEGLMGAMECMPVLEETGIKSFVHGADTHSADHLPVLGRIPSTENVYVASGFNSQGIQLGYGIGKMMAELVMEEVPTFKYDSSSLDITRFSPQLASDDSFCQDRALEGYGQMYSIPFPGLDWQTHRDLRKSPLHDTLQQRGAVFGSVPSQGWERPLWFGNGEYSKEPDSLMTYDLKDTAWYKATGYEHHACRNQVALFDMTTFGKFIVTGKDAYQTLESLTSAHLEPCMTGNKIMYTQLLNKNGGIESDLTIVPLPGKEPAFYCITGASIVGRDMSYIAHQGQDVRLKDVTSEYAVLALMGPRSKALLEGITSEPLDDEGFPFATWKDLGFGYALRMSYVGELGWELHVPFQNAEVVLRALEEVSMGLFQMPLTLGGYNAILRSLRIEKRFVHFGHDVSQMDTPLEAGFLFVNKKLKAGVDFVGREALLRQKEGKLTKKIVSVMVEDDTPLWGHENLYRNGELVGYLTSAGIGYTVNNGKCIGMGFIRNKDGIDKEYLKEGQYTVEARGRHVPVTLHARPLYDPKNERLKSSSSVLAPSKHTVQMPGVTPDAYLFKHRIANGVDAWQ
eukprot:TRINITY_DN913_c0_g2_i1.p1 TRINITY_DN913_c0_g2~~TRINITY_DN913_c0_g2_i1.p1  ORF type:complete len:863 (+),score=208.61 TRINITY_DN913_c0_g2_i1:72-2660(+)